MAILSILVGLVLGYGAVEELIVRGIRGGEVQPGIVGAVAAVASALLILSGVAQLRRWPNAWRLVLAAALLCVAVHTYGALPPHRNVGPLALLLGTGYGVSLLAVELWKTRTRRNDAAPV